MVYASKLTVLLLFTTIFSHQQVIAAVIYDEAVDGDFSLFPDPNSPLNLNPGSNEIIGAISKIPIFTDSDVITFTLDTNEILNSIILLGYTSFVESARFGVAEGVECCTGSLGGYTFTASDIGTDMLLNATVPQLSDGLYTIYISSSNSSISESLAYHLDFQITTVPLPPAIYMFGTGLLVLFFAGQFRSPSEFSLV